MKAFNLMALSLGGAILISVIIAMIASQVFSEEIAMPVTLILSFIVGHNSRKVTEKILGYTAEESMKE